MSNIPQSLDALINSITPEIHESLKQAIALGRWDNGEKLTSEQVDLCMQAVIAYDAQRLPEEERVAYIDRTKLKTQQCPE